MRRALELLLFFILASLLGCAEKNNETLLTGKTMGTQYHISVITSPTKNQIDQAALQAEIDTLLDEINQQMSTYLPNSEISQFNQYKKIDWFTVSEDFSYVVSSAQDVSRLTHGAFDITVAPLIGLWGFGVTSQLTPPTQQQISGVLKNIGYQQLDVRLSPPALRKLNKNLSIDLSAIAKGFAVDKITELLSHKNYANFLVEIGGEVRNRGLNQKGKPWKIGIEIPGKNMGRVNKVLSISNMALATSGDYRNFYIKDGIRFSHTINPNTGKPITHKLSSVTVLHESTMLADAYATALMVLGSAKGKTFAKEKALKVNMIIRSNSGNQVWTNFDESKLF